MKKLLALAGLTVLFGCGQPELQVVVPLAVVNFAPQNGAVGIDTATVPTVCFNLEMDAAKAASALSLDADGGGAVPGLQVVAANDPHCLSLPHEKLSADTSYVIRAKQGLAAKDGTTLAVDLTSQFRTAAQ